MKTFEQLYRLSSMIKLLKQLRNSRKWSKIQSLKRVFYSTKSWQWKIKKQLKTKIDRKQIIKQFQLCFLLYSRQISKLLKISNMLKIFDYMSQRSTFKSIISFWLSHSAAILDEKRMKLNQLKKLQEKLNISQIKYHK